MKKTPHSNSMEKYHNSNPKSKFSKVDLQRIFEKENIWKNSQSKCFFLGPISSSVDALQMALASPWPAMECLAARSRSLSVWPAETAILSPRIWQKWGRQDFSRWPKDDKTSKYGTNSVLTNKLGNRIFNWQSQFFRQLAEIKTNNLTQCKFPSFLSETPEVLLLRTLFM